jgi:hypothetical protein
LSSQAEFENLRLQFQGDIDKLEATHQQALDESEEIIVQLQMQVSTLESKYNKRDSRPEDIERIRKLEEMVVEAQEEVKRVEEEMKYFKLELVNREENFNKNFGNQPRVGLMDSSNAKKAPNPRGTKFPTLGPTSSSAPSGPTRPRATRRGSVN